MCSCSRPPLHDFEDDPLMAQITDLQTKVMIYNQYPNSWFSPWSNPLCFVWLVNSDMGSAGDIRQYAKAVTHTGNQKEQLVEQ